MSNFTTNVVLILLSHAFCDKYSLSDAVNYDANQTDP